ncbi:MAG TPA: aldo/keto reductase, partial [Amaricoccus sp.]|nr:aldo/keto reductase [Amaricoccus sp.]
MQRIRLAPDHEISRVIRGGWQMAGGHGPIEAGAAVEDLLAFADAGITTFDCADIYTGVEELLGAFRARWRELRGAEALTRIKVHTKCVPDLDLLPRLRRADIEAVIDRSLARLGAERLDLVQFHWWDYAAPGWIEAAGWLDDLRRAGKIRHLGGTNFDTERMTAIVDAGVP